MLCPNCETGESQVTDTRDAGRAIRRRRECLSCGFRFTTFERIETRRFSVIKKDGRREAFDRNKVFNGIAKACEKRPISKETVENITSAIEKELAESLHSEIPAEHIGELVMEKLKKLDPVAYIRFASVYQSFENIAAYEQALKQLKK